MKRVKKNGKYFMTTTLSMSDDSGLEELYEFVLADTLARYHRISDYAVSYQNEAEYEGTVSETALERNKRFSISLDHPLSYGKDVTEQKVNLVLEYLKDKNLLLTKEDGSVVLDGKRYKEAVLTEIRGLSNFLNPSAWNERLFLELEKNLSCEIPVLSETGKDKTAGVNPLFAECCIYLIGTGFGADETEKAEMGAVPNVDLLIIDTVKAKEILPGLLILHSALGVPIPRQVYVHPKVEYHEEEGTPVPRNERADALADIFGVDAVRYYLLFQTGETETVSVNAQEVYLLAQRDLSGVLSTLVNTVLTVSAQFFDSVIHNRNIHDESGQDEALDQIVCAMAEKYRTEMNAFRIGNSLKCVMDVYKALSEYMSKTQPWKLAEEGNMDRAETVLYHLLDGIQTATSVIGAFLPATCDLIKEQIHSPEVSCDELHLSGHFVSGNCLSHDARPIFDTMNYKEAMLNY